MTAAPGLVSGVARQASWATRKLGSSAAVLANRSRWRGLKDDCSVVRAKDT